MLTLYENLIAGCRFNKKNEEQLKVIILSKIENNSTFYPQLQKLKNINFKPIFCKKLSVFICLIKTKKC